MKYRFTDASVGTVAFYEQSLMGDEYEPPGVTVRRDDDGIPWFRVRKELADAFDADDRFERYGDDADADGAGSADGADDADSDADGADSDTDAADGSDAAE